MVIEGQKLAPVLAALVVGIVSWPSEQANSIAPPRPVPAQSVSGPKKAPTPTFPFSLRDPFQRASRRSSQAQPAAAAAAQAKTAVARPKLELPPITGLMVGSRRRVVFFGRDAVVEGQVYRGVLVARVEAHGVQLEVEGAPFFKPFPELLSGVPPTRRPRAMEVVR